MCVLIEKYLRCIQKTTLFAQFPKLTNIISRFAFSPPSQPPLISTNTRYIYSLHCKYCDFDFEGSDTIALVEHPTFLTADSYLTLRDESARILQSQRQC